MSVNVTVNGTSYSIPQTGETGWGAVVTSWIQAVSSSTLQKNGGTFTLTAEAYFGASFGIKSLYYKSSGVNPSGTGILRLANAEAVAWRNAGNSADLPLTVNASDQLTYNSIRIDNGTSYNPNNHGVVLSGSANVLTVIAPDASTVKTLISGGASADPAWGILALGGGGTGATSKAGAFDALSPMSASGDIIYGGASGTGTCLAKGSDTQVLTLASGLPSWASPVTGITTVGTIDSQTASNDGAVITGGTTIVLQSASSTKPGLVNTTPQTLAGTKSLSGGWVTGSAGTLNTTSDSNLGTISSVTSTKFYIGSFSYSFNGVGFTATQTITVRYMLDGRRVTLEFPQTLATAGTASALITGSAAIPSALRPGSANDQFFFISSRENGSTFTGAIEIGTGGVVSIYRSTDLTTQFTNGAANIGWLGTSVTYMTS